MNENMVDDLIDEINIFITIIKINF